MNDPDRERKRITRVIDYLMSFATEVEKADITCPQPVKSSTTWSPWLSRLKAISEILQTKAMAALFVAEHATMSPEDIKKIKLRSPYVSSMASRIGAFIDVQNNKRKVAHNAAEGFSKLFRKSI